MGPPGTGTAPGRTACVPAPAPMLPAGALRRTRLLSLLDDFEVVTDAGLVEQLGAIIEQAPSTHHFVLATRIDPPLRYSRLRLVDGLGEVRKEDLAFTPEEAVELLGRLGNGALSPPQVDA